MNWSQELKTYTHTCLSRRLPALGARRPEVEQALAGCGEEERLLLSFVYATLPITDVGDYSPAGFLQGVRHALRVREEFPWCAALPEHRFLKDVLYPRVNTEELSPCREQFYEELRPRVEGLPLPEAILEVNRWCAEHVTYRSTDGRTASPLQVYQRGFGRCGEESTFLVTALRSVGIAARQVYVPWWSHCDDNHAWVEAFDGASWRYLGACEPEPILDRGWFTYAAARAVMVHTRAFVQGGREEAAFLFPHVAPQDWDIQEGVAVENITARYAPVKELEITVLGEDGSPAAGAWVSVAVMNMAAPREVARRRADDRGRVTLKLGKGTVLLSAWEDSAPSLCGELLVEPEACCASLILGQRLPAGGEADFLAPQDGGLTVPPLKEEQRLARAAVLDHAAASREERARAYRALAGALPQGERGRLWDSLTEKDRAGLVPDQVLEDGLDAFVWEKNTPPQAFEEGLLSPRVGLEVLTPWRKLLKGAFSPQQQEAARQDPSQLWRWVKEAAPLESHCYQSLWGTPQGMLSTGAATAQGQALLFCAACRALGIPAKLSDGVPQVWREGSFLPLWGDAPTARLTLQAPEGHPGLEGQNYTLSRWEGHGFREISTGQVPAGGARELRLVPGEYRLWMVNRLPGGSLLSRWGTVSLQAGEAKTCALSFREGDVADLLERCPLPDFSLEDGQGRVVKGRELLALAPLTLLCFLEVNREPTEHLLGELQEAAGELKRAGLPLCFVLPDLSQREDPTLARALGALPEATLWQAPFGESASPLARRMYLDPDQLPLALLANSNGEGLYGCCGYNVGTAALLLRLVAGLEKNGKMVYTKKVNSRI